MSLLQPHDFVLFQGDSITDAGRDRAVASDLGGGYAAMIAGRLRAERADLGVRVWNRGVSGDRTVELLGRWPTDTVALKPSVLSIMIGVNDVWRKRESWNGQTFVPLADYRAHLRSLTQSALEAGVRQLILMSPTTIDADNDSDLNHWLAEYAAAAAEHAVAIGAMYLDVRSPLMALRRDRPELTPDGCHPSIEGHAVIAALWWKAVVQRA